MIVRTYRWPNGSDPIELGIDDNVANELLEVLRTYYELRSSHLITKPYPGVELFMAELEKVTREAARTAILETEDA